MCARATKKFSDLLAFQDIYESPKKTSQIEKKI